jgi:AcrR family transcriptional regulator
MLRFSQVSIRSSPRLEVLMPVSPRGPYKNGIKTRRDIIESASQVFGRFGYSGGSLKQIAENVGVTPAALLQHFGSKESVLIAVLERWSADTVRQVPTEPTGLGFFARLSKLMDYHTEHRGFIELFLTIATEASDPSHPARHFMTHRYDELIDASVRELTFARDNGEVQNFADEELVKEIRALYAVMDGIELQWLLNPEIDLVGTFTYHLELTLSRWTFAGEKLQK